MVVASPTGDAGHLIEQMTEHDLLEVVEIETECALSKWGWEAYYNEIMNGATMLVARARGTAHDDLRGRLLCGFAAARRAGDQLHINNLGVRRSCRRHGVGRSLLAMTIGQAAQAGVREVNLEVRPSNEAAIALYLRAGFRIVGRRPGYYASPPEDALLMSAALQTKA